jgi:hypothetical protein
MKTASRLTRRVEFGDFQTPIGLARRVADRVAGLGCGTERFAPASIVEPSCGEGNLLFAAADRFPEFRKAVGVEIQPRYIERLCERRATRADGARISVCRANFFEHEWATTLATLPEPMLVIGNPPWVTNAELSAGGSSNLPVKSNFQRQAGMDAITGKSNFDISEAMLLCLSRLLAGRDAILAMLCKTNVARKVLVHAWRTGTLVRDAALYRIDSAAEFGAAVDACLFMCRLGTAPTDRAAHVFPSLVASTPTGQIGFRDGRLLANAGMHDRWGHLAASEGGEAHRWRSGIKHDCAEVCELTGAPGAWRAAGGAGVDIEPDYVYPMLKASDLGNGRVHAPRRWMLVTQRRVGEDTAAIAGVAPRTWAYLQANAERFQRRASVIYRNRPPFSMFGVGEYSFAPWKVAIAGLYKKIDFSVVGPCGGKPIVLDDTGYFLPCSSRDEAEVLASLLNSDAAREFYSAFAFWDAKRPITVDLLRRLDLRRLAAALGRSADLDRVKSTSKAPAADGLLPLWNE